MIGDGMGLPAVYAAMTVSDYPLNIRRSTSVGLQKTFSSNAYITYSGAAAGVALDFAEKDKQTLVVITADHETGGVTLLDCDIKSRKVILHFSPNDHTAAMAPVYA